MGANRLNIALKARINPAAGTVIEIGSGDGLKVFSIGDRVMQTRNNKHLDITNGQIGYIRKIGMKGKSATVDFDGQRVDLNVRTHFHDLDLAYASTVHKFQGSESLAVIIPMSRAHSVMLNRQILYTAVTRGKSVVAINGDTYMLKRAVENAEAMRRFTGLKECLRGEREKVMADMPMADRMLRAIRNRGVGMQSKMF